MVALAGEPAGVNLTGAYTLTPADNGRTFVIDGNTANRTITVPAGLPLGFTFFVYCNSTANNVVVQFTSPERLRQSGSTTTAGGTATFLGASDTGYATTIRKVSDSGFANTYWGTFGGVGNLTLA
jgi:hypothetical protein